jgi:hypothetical protein
LILATIIVIIITIIVVVVPIAPLRADGKWSRIAWCGWVRLNSWRRNVCSLDDLVEFTSVEPDSPALGAVVDLNPGSFRHY